MNRTEVIKTLIILIPTLLICKISGGENIYKWIDDDGTVRYTDSESKIPKDKVDDIELIEKSNIETYGHLVIGAYYFEILTIQKRYPRVRVIARDLIV